MKKAHIKQKFQVWIEKKHFQDDYTFGMRQLKGLKLSQIILTYVTILFAKFESKKVKHNKVRGFSTKTSLKCVKAAVLFKQPASSSTQLSNWRILVSGALPLGQAVLVADARHQILEAGDPGARLLPVAGHQVQGLHVLSVVQAEAAVGIEAALRVALEDLRLLPFTHLADRVDGDCRREKQSRVSAVTKLNHFRTWPLVQCTTKRNNVHSASISSSILRDKTFASIKMMANKVTLGAILTPHDYFGFW